MLYLRAGRRIGRLILVFVLAVAVASPEKVCLGPPTTIGPPRS